LFERPIRAVGGVRLAGTEQIERIGNNRLAVEGDLVGTK
jgi:hypothetical protein